MLSKPTLAGEQNKYFKNLSHGDDELLVQVRSMLNNKDSTEAQKAFFSNFFQKNFKPDLNKVTILSPKEMVHSKTYQFENLKNVQADLCHFLKSHKNIVLLTLSELIDPDRWSEIPNNSALKILLGHLQDKLLHINNSGSIVSAISLVESNFLIASIGRMTTIFRTFAKLQNMLLCLVPQTAFKSQEDYISFYTTTLKAQNVFATAITETKILDIENNARSIKDDEILEKIVNLNFFNPNLQTKVRMTGTLCRNEYKRNLTDGYFKSSIREYQELLSACSAQNLHDNVNITCKNISKIHHTQHKNINCHIPEGVNLSENVDGTSTNTLRKTKNSTPSNKLSTFVKKRHVSIPLCPYEASGHITIYNDLNECFVCINTVKSVLCSDFYMTPEFSWSFFTSLGTCPICQAKNDSNDGNLDLISGLETTLFDVAQCSLQIHRNNLVSTTCSFGNEFLASIDLSYILNARHIEKFWNNRIKKVRHKVPAKERLHLDWQASSFSPKLIKDFHKLSFSDKITKNEFLDRWMGLKTKISTKQYFLDFQRQKHWRFFISSKSSNNSPSTDSWTRPPGLNTILTNPNVGIYYKFCDGSHYFPKDYKKGSSKSFLTRSRIKDGAILNPPYSSPLLDRMIAKIILLSNTSGGVFPVIIPLWRSAVWFRALEALSTPFLILQRNVSFRRGIDEEYVGEADFKTAIAFIGAFASEQFGYINNDKLGFALDFKYIRWIQKIQFPVIMRPNEKIEIFRHTSWRMDFIFSILSIAENIDKTIRDADITNDFDFEVMKKYNHVLQNVRNISACKISHLWANTLDPNIDKFVIWQKFKESTRVIYTYQTASKFLENLKFPPKNKFKKLRCIICKSMGHIASRCPFKIPSSVELGLKAREEKILYQFLCGQEFTTSPSDIDHFDSKETFFFSAKKWLKMEAKFWDDWKKYALECNIINPRIVIENTEFSKGRQALGFNFSMGAPLSELLLDAFGAVLELTDPPLIVNLLNALTEITNNTQKLMLC